MASLPAEESYRRMHDWLRLAFAELQVETELAPGRKISLPGQCFAGHEKFDLLWQGKKIAGAAQRRNRFGLLIQGSVQPPPLPLKRAQFEAAMCAGLLGKSAAVWTELALDAVLRRRAEALAAEKFSQAAFNRKR